MELWWAKACAGSYYLREKPGGRGTSVGKVWKRQTKYGAAHIYDALFDHAGAYITFTERGQPKTIIAMLEGQIIARFPEAVFEKEGF